MQQELMNSPIIVAICHNRSEGKICEDTKIVVRKLLFSFLPFLLLKSPKHTILHATFHDCFLHLLCLLQDGVFVPKA